MIEKDNVMCGTMVIVKEDFTPVCYWFLGCVVEVYHGSDGKVRIDEQERGIMVPITVFRHTPRATESQK
ncbi:hypothetical protein TNCV_4230861 [Trichonephila clavipes]|uniref:DUF5641 domain-containing protein n=1 Tax=Trichonephila clavipes TaxID=2585209 RepID=A0A8X6VB00_TRICX|nr:hypothetical protein TNCV_4230861 [Trichonephila clavipes]